MRIPITRNFDSSKLVGFMEIQEDFAAELVALAKEGLTFRLDTGLRYEGDQATLVEVSVSSPFPSVLSDTLMMKPIFLSREDEEDAYDEFMEDEDEEVVLPIHPPLKPQAYDTAFVSIVRGKNNRALLLQEGYVFDVLHSLQDVLPYEFSGGDYQAGGISVELKMEEMARSLLKPDLSVSLNLHSIVFENIEGPVHGCVVYNEIGLIVHIPLDLEAQGGNVTIQAPPA